MMIYNCGDVVLLPFPFTDLTTAKQRPAVVISSSWFNSNRKDIIVAAITSQVSTSLARDEIHLPVQEQSRAGLPKPSIVKVTKIVTIDQSLVRKRLGSLSPKFMKKLTKTVKQFIG
ncbi:MAG: type II toxin-antitoxin system PemK/MazF family toxin [Candidatus Sigynarchaeota archaeon]